MLKQRHLFFALLALSLVGASGTIDAKSKSRHAAAVAPQIDRLAINPVNQFAPGSELVFTLEGTPHGVATVRAGNIARNIVLQETDKGVYEGTYTISSRDHLTASDTLHGTLKVRGRQAVINQPIGTLPVAPAVAASVPTVTATTSASSTASSTAAGAPPATFIEHFTVIPISKIEPGAELKFNLSGLARSKASFSIEGIVKDVPMVETQPGVYEGAYTIRRLDNFPPAINITATLDANGQAVRSRLTQSLLIEGKPPVIKNMSPHQGETIITNPVLISATFDDTGGIGIDTKTVRVVVGGSDVTRSASITPQFFSYRADLKPGTTTVDVSAKDNNGKALHQAWSFVVASVAAPAPTTLSLQITSHANNAQVGTGPIDIKGRTSADAKIDVQVQAVASIAGFFGLSQQIYTQSLRSDANGNFMFSFQPQVTVPGTRYEVTIAASKGELNKETKLVLFQQK